MWTDRTGVGPPSICAGTENNFAIPKQLVPLNQFYLLNFTGYSTVRLIVLISLIYCVTRVSFHVCSLVVITFRNEPSYHVNRNGIKRLGYYLPKPNYSTVTVGPGVLFLHDTSSIRWGLIRSGILGDTSTHVLVPQFPLKNGGLIPEILQKILMMV